MREEQEGLRRPYQPPHGYARAKALLIDEYHRFERARRDFGFEEGVFVDGAFLSSSMVIELAKLSRRERYTRITEERRATKGDAYGAVSSYMLAMHVTADELDQYLQKRTPACYGEDSTRREELTHLIREREYALSVSAVIGTTAATTAAAAAR